MITSAMIITTEEMVSPHSNYDVAINWNEAAARKLLPLIRDMGLRALHVGLIPFSVRARNALIGSGLLTVYDLRKLTRREVESIPHSGLKVRHEVYHLIKEETGIIMPNWLDA